MFIFNMLGGRWNGCSVTIFLCSFRTKNKSSQSLSLKAVIIDGSLVVLSIIEHVSQSITSFYMPFILFSFRHNRIIYTEVIQPYTYNN